MNSENEVVEKVRAWLSSMVIGLNLCPFAEKVASAGTIRYVVCDSADETELLETFAKELRFLSLASRNDIETTILILPKAPPAFLDFNDLVGDAEELIKTFQFEGVVQLVGFHPKFQFADTAADAPETYTNRSPFPLFHLLREESITELSKTEEELLTIPIRNVQTLKRLGLDRILERLKKIE